MKTLIPISILIFSFFLFSCSSVKETDLSKSLDGTSWVLKTIKGNPDTPPTAKDVTLLFDKSGSKISGFGGCNSYFGQYLLSKDTLLFSGIGSTELACDDLQTESEYYAQLKKTDKYKISSNKLTLYGSGSVLMTFERKQ